MEISEATLRRIAAMSHEAMVEALLFYADEAATTEARKSKDRERKRRGKSTEPSGSSAENPWKSTEAEAPYIDNNTNTSELLEKSTSVPTPQSRHERRVTRGTRWPDDFVPKPSSLEAWRLRGGGSDEEYWDEFESTKNYWQQRPGAKGLSLNWDLVWLNRVKDVCNKKKERLNGRSTAYSKPLSISERLAGFAARLEASEGGDSGGGETVASLPGLRKSA